MSRLGRIAVILGALGLLAGAGAGHAAAAPGSRYFPETGHTIHGRFLAYWEQHGGLAQQGYPLSEELQESSDLNGKIYTVQYFERAVFEYHPENTSPYDVLLSQLGRFRYAARYGQTPPPAPTVRVPGTGSRTFPETGHTVRGLFLTYWEQHGGLAQQGYPLSEELQESSDLNGKIYTVQYFERAVFEYHPENTSPYDVLLSQLGRFRYAARYGSGPRATPSPAGAGGGQVIARDLFGPPSAAGSYIFWATGVGGASTLHAYDRTRGQAFILASGPHAKYPVMSDGQTAVWYDEPPAAPPSIQGYDLAAGRAFPIYTPTDPEEEFGAFAVASGVVYFQDVAPGAHSRQGIYARTISTGQETQFTPGVPGYTVDKIVATGDVLLWAGTKTQGQPATTTLFLHRLAPGAPDQPIANGLDPYSIAAAGDRVVWGLGFNPLDEVISVYTISSGTLHQVTMGGYAGHPLVQGIRVLWTQAPNEGAPSGGAIELYDLDTGKTAPVVQSDTDRVDVVAFVGEEALLYTVTHGDGTVDLLLAPLFGGP